MAIYNLLDQTSGLNMLEGVLSMRQIEDTQPLNYVQGNLLTASVVVVTVFLSRSDQASAHTFVKEL